MVNTLPEEILRRDARPFFQVGQRVRVVYQDRPTVGIIVEIQHWPYEGRPRYHQVRLNNTGLQVWDSFWLDLEPDRCDCNPDKLFQPNCLDCVLKRFP